MKLLITYDNYDVLYDEVEVLLRAMPFCWYNTA